MRPRPLPLSTDVGHVADVSIDASVEDGKDLKRLGDSMIIDRIDPPSLHPIPGAAHVTVAEGRRIIHVSGQAGRNTDGSLASETVGGQAVQALRNLRTALDAAGAGLADVAHLTVYIVDYTAASLDALMEAAIGEYGEAYPITACTLVGVAALWEAGVLIEIDAMAVV